MHLLSFEDTVRQSRATPARLLPLLLAAALSAGCGSPGDTGSGGSGGAAGSGAQGGGGSGGIGGTGTGGTDTGTGGTSTGGTGGGGFVTSCALGDTVACADLAGIYASGQASCRPSGSGYDVRECKLIEIANAQRVREIVQPASRDPSRWKDATCSQGGDFVFDISFPAGMDLHDAHTWQLELQGGGFCFSDGSDAYANGSEDCPVRSEHLVASVDQNGNPLPADGTTEKDPAGGAAGFEETAVLVHAYYCSNDFWTGTRTRAEGVPIPYPENGPTTDWSFAGHINVEAMVATLVERYGLDDDDVDLLVHARGSSAGGWGTLNNLWFYRSALPKTAAARRLRASAWAAFIPFTWDDPDFPPLHLPGAKQEELFAHAVDMWKSVLTPSCVAQNAASPGRCYSADWTYELLTDAPPQGLGIPLLVFQNSQDQLYMDRFASLPIVDGASAKELAARSEWVDKMNTALGLTPGQPNASSRVKWLYAVSDPRTSANDTNVHPPQDYELSSPLGPDSSVQAMTQEFLSGPADATKVVTFDCDWVLSGGQHGACP